MRHYKLPYTSDEELLKQYDAGELPEELADLIDRQVLVDCIEENSIDGVKWNITYNMGNFIHDNRTEQNLSIRKLSEKSGVSTAVISDLENYRSLPSIEILLKLTFAMNIIIDELFEALGTNVNLLSYEEKIKQKKEAEYTLDDFLYNKGLNKIQISEVKDFIEYKLYQNKK